MVPRTSINLSSQVSPRCFLQAGYSTHHFLSHLSPVAQSYQLLAWFEPASFGSDVSMMKNQTEANHLCRPYQPQAHVDIYRFGLHSEKYLFVKKNKALNRLKNIVVRNLLSKYDVSSSSTRLGTNSTFCLRREFQSSPLK